MQGIADYEFLRPLGAGTYGQVFLARRPVRLPIEAEYVAVKVLAAESTADTFRRAARELRAAAAVRSPYLVNLHDAGQHDGIFYYAMEFLPEGSLRRPAHPLDEAAIIRTVADAARAIASLHAAGFVHRNVKPGNVLLTTVGAKLADLNLGEVFQPGITLTGLGPVTAVEFTDPELLQGEPARPHNDVWSLGVLLHHALTGVGVFRDLPRSDGPLVLRRMLTTPAEVSPSLPGPIAQLVRDCLAPSSDRPSAAVLADRLAARSN
jgi:eukaryotic-like serine/threonine-protein kinase